MTEDDKKLVKDLRFIDGLDRHATAANCTCAAARIEALSAEVEVSEAANRAKSETIVDLQARVALLREALTDAKDHLEYTGYGDSWERECATAQKLPEKIDKALEVTK